MQDAPVAFDPDLTNLPKGEWLTKLATIADAEGFFEPLGRKHFAAHVRRGDTLLVSFETIEGIRSLTKTEEPMGWARVRGNNWSHLAIVSDGDTWFRDRHIYALFDRLADDGFFDDFETVVFYGAGPGGYAAAAYSVAAPGARVLAVQPQATLDPRVTEWDDRFTHMRRTDFTHRYGFAPDMLDACDKAFILFDPMERLDAMHAALFTRPGVTALRMRNMGASIQSNMIEMHMLGPILRKLAEDRLTEVSFARDYRVRRKHHAYLRRTMAALDARERPHLAYILARNVNARLNAPRFAKRVQDYEAAQKAADTAAPEAD